MSHALKKLSPVLLVDAIEPCLPFWERLGWVNVAEVPHGDVLGFVILVKDGLEVMYQTRASVAADIAALTDLPTGGTFLFLEVDDLDAVIREIAGAPRVFERRTTFYGMDEIGVREPGGNSITFAMKVG
ncbi:MAG: VOC family protein [Gemmatimonadetes bacterium]|nr:VOC family protein [Gemmatimonadota bacterium]